MSALGKNVCPPTLATTKLSCVGKQVERAPLKESLDLSGPLVMEVYGAYYDERIARNVSLFSLPFLIA